MSSVEYIPVPVLTLNDGHKFPSLGLGCWMGKPGESDIAYKMVQDALKLGYRQIDTAFGYGNEEAVGKAIRDSGIPREEIFVTTKLTDKHHGAVARGFDLSFKNLNIGYIDLYLMHWPQAENLETGERVLYGQSPTFVETWKDMEKLLGTGKVRSIGVSNFSIKNLEILLPQVKIVPAVNQVEMNPYLPQNKLIQYCKSKGIICMAYGPLGQYQNTFLDDPEIKSVAEKNGVSPAQVCLSWAVQRGTVPIPKSQNPERLKANISIFKLSKEDFDVIDLLHKQPGKHRSLDWYTNYVPGEVSKWTYEQMGWSLNKKGEVVGDYD